MFVVLLLSLAMVALTTLIHYEALTTLNNLLPKIAVERRRKLLVVMTGIFAAHIFEIVLYGLLYYGLILWDPGNAFTGSAPFSLLNCIYFSAETYTSLGFGDLSPVGPIRLLAGLEALNGLLLISWSASYTYLAMERFWKISARD